MNTDSDSVLSNKMSRRVMGVGIIATGLLVLTIALIIGLEFPKTVYNRNLEAVCVMSTTHPYYNDWVRDSHRDHFSSLTYWNLGNPLFLSHMQTPEVKERGPYVYREKQYKIDVKFSGKIVSYRMWRRQEFDAEATLQQCGADCKENDMITMMNPSYLKFISDFGSSTNYALYRTPAVIVDVLRAVTSQQLHADNMLHTMALMGVIDNTVMVDNVLHASGFDFSNDFEQFSFGSWLSLNNTSDKMAILDYLGGRNLTSVHMGGLYAAITNPDIFGATQSTLNGDTTPKVCELTLVVPNDLTYLMVEQPLYASHYLPPGDAPPSSHPAVSHSSSASTSSSTPDSRLSHCGLAVCLRRFNEPLSARELFNLSGMIAKYLCTNTSTSCLQIPEYPVELRYSFIKTIGNYVLDHLPKFVFYQSVIVTGDNIVVTRPQRELALGYSLGGSSISQYVGLSLNELVPGILPHDDTMDAARRHVKMDSLYNCYDATAAVTNFMWHAYSDQTHSSVAQFPAAPQAARAVRSRRYNMPPARNLSACTNYSLPDPAPAFFHPAFWRRLNFTGARPDTAPSLRGITLDRLQLNMSTLRRDETFVWEPGLQNMTGSNGFRSWVSLPRLQLVDPPLRDLFQLAADQQSYLPYVDFELVSGEAWRQRWWYQQNVGVLPEYLPSWEQPPSTHPHFDRPIPVYWVETGFDLSDTGYDVYHQKVGRLMAISCGGLIGLSVVAALIILAGILAATLTVRNGRIAPIEVQEVSMY